MKNSTKTAAIKAAPSKAAPKSEVAPVTPPQPLLNVAGTYAFDNTKIEWIVKDNPKRPSGKAHARFAAYMKAKTVGEYLSLGGTKADLNYDVDKKFLSIISE